MTRKKHDNIRRIPTVALDMDKPDHVALWDYYQTLTHEGEGTDWIRSTLIAAMPARTALPAAERVRLAGFKNARFGVAQKAEPEDVSYEDVE